jgi:16S rRNA (uracil1498-N3)-methyltransferase
MRRFFVEKITHPAVLPPRESRHAVRALRLGPGDRVVVFDPREAWSGEIESIEGEVRVRLLDRLPPMELPRVVVASAAPKGPRLDWMVEKLGEFGVSEFIPVRFARSATEVGEAKRRRLEKVAEAAAKQSGAPLMRVAPERGVEEVPADALLVIPGASEPLPPGPGLVVVGPEGGLTPEEERRFARRHALGRPILRIETAAVVAAARRLG